jgi:hypothetical protein
MKANAESPGEQLGVLLTHAAANRAVLLKLGAPADAIESFGYNIRNIRNWKHPRWSRRDPDS